MVVFTPTAEALDAIAVFNEERPVDKLAAAADAYVETSPELTAT